MQEAVQKLTDLGRDRVEVLLSLALALGMLTYLSYYWNRFTGPGGLAAITLVCASLVALAMLLIGQRVNRVLRVASVLSFFLIIGHVVGALAFFGASLPFVLSNGAELVVAGTLWAMTARRES